MSTKSVNTPEETADRGLDGATCSPFADYNSWIEALRYVDHLSDSQLCRIGQIVAHRLRYRSAFYLSEMIEHASRELRQQLENSQENSFINRPDGNDGDNRPVG